MLCVLIAHALFIHALRGLTSGRDILRGNAPEEFVTELIIPKQDVDGESFEWSPFIDERDGPLARLASPAMSSDATADAGDDGAAATSQPGYVDWPQEGKDAAARVLAREAEAERIAKMFAGPQGTWASLTKRQQSEFNHFRWKPGVDGLERDENGTTIYHINDRCVLVAFVFIGCKLGGKPPAYGDLFKDMRKYFDEQRLPRTNEGNGTEPESKRPPKWSKPLPERAPGLNVP